MKQVILSLCLLVIVNANNFSQTGTAVNAEPELISFKLKNNSLLPVKITVISYRPDETGNGTKGIFIISYGSVKFSFPVGTKIYLASSEQINTVMSGAKISDQEPFLVVKKEDQGQSFKIN
jgi:hypothetical protein